MQQKLSKLKDKGIEDTISGAYREILKVNAHEEGIERRRLLGKFSEMLFPTISEGHSMNKSKEKCGS